MYILTRKYIKSNGEVVEKTYQYEKKPKREVKKPKRTKWDIQRYNSEYYQKNRLELLNKMKNRRCLNESKKNFKKVNKNPNAIPTVIKKTNLIIVSF